MDIATDVATAVAVQSNRRPLAQIWRASLIARNGLRQELPVVPRRGGRPNRGRWVRAAAANRLRRCRGTSVSRQRAGEWDRHPQGPAALLEPRRERANRRIAETASDHGENAVKRRISSARRDNERAVD